MTWRKAVAIALVWAGAGVTTTAYGAGVRNGNASSPYLSDVFGESSVVQAASQEPVPTPTPTPEEALVDDSWGEPVCCPDTRRWYLGISGAWQQREIVHEVSEPTTFLTFDDGFGLSAFLGYRFDVFRMETEVSWLNNGIDTAGAGGLSSAAPGNVSLRVYMLNFYHDFKLQCSCWSPYVGAGIGFYQSEINGLLPDFFSIIGGDFTNTGLNVTSNIPFAYQFKVGASRPLSDRTDLFLGYRYLRGEELTFSGQPFGTFHPDAAKNHNFDVGIRIKF